MTTLYAEPRADGRVVLYADADRARVVTIAPRGRIDRRARVVILGETTAPLVWLPPLPVCVVVPRIERGVLRAPNAVLFLGRTEVWAHVGGHSECSADYYSATKAPRSPAERDAAAMAVAQYRTLMQSRPMGERCDVVARARMPGSFR